MLRRIQWIWKGLKIKERIGIIDESRSQRKEEGLSSTAQHRNGHLFLCN